MSSSSRNLQFCYGLLQVLHVVIFATRISLLPPLLLQVLLWIAAMASSKLHIPLSFNVVTNYEFRLTFLMQMYCVSSSFNLPCA
ncbi:hypothetical protein KSP39_PZI023071 [Platanthera zijinensis]|uniref:Uncharacterized protein n=1 Tax=Platanthera zijinensis TaxID=2320716 RepID=A0AAP0AVK5_9ASPA